MSVFPVVLVVGCARGVPDDPPDVSARYWLQVPHSAMAIRDAAEQVRSAVAVALGDAGLEPGYPRGCGVTETPPATGPWRPECVEDSVPHDALMLGSDGRFLQFLTLDFPNARLFAFEVYLLPEPRLAQILSLEDLSTYPRIAIPPFPLPEDNYRRVLTAVAQGIASTGATPLAYSR